MGPIRKKFRMVRVGVDMALWFGCSGQRKELLRRNREEIATYISIGVVGIEGGMFGGVEAAVRITISRVNRLLS